MRKLLYTFLIGVAVLTLSACTPSSISESTEANDGEIQGIVVGRTTEASTITMPPSSSYTIPEGAETGENGGPGAMSTTAVDYSYYPEDKQPVAVEEQGTMIILYVPASKGITVNFDYVDTCDAQSVIQALINNNALTSDVDMESFEVDEDGKSATLIISDCTAVYAAASEDEVITAVANTFLDNFSLYTIDIIAHGTDFGVREYSQEYNATKNNK